MPDPNKTEIIVVLDRSGSMQSIRADMIGGFGRFIAEQNELEGRCDVSLYTFDTYHETEYERRPAAKVPPLNLQPRGGTALWDAVCMAIDKVGRDYAGTRESDRPGKVIFVIITDGEENSSREHTQRDVKARIERQRGEYGWQFVFLGANIDAQHYAEQMGVAQGSSRGYGATGQGVRDMYGATGGAIRAYRQGLRSQVSFEPSVDYSEAPKPAQQEEDEP